ncbi:hypothetical protein N7466_001081 [Penicillium verhagenii]|uniref:uncharacterized protein n=1 Tax=Penicillium verhagenii TaxID=1562060 RepID=UPI00254568CB|nr:uncharacterized protein N7466_001081 [Penicillium verhagenii]KAJ5948066.1 hypothetical protein N7466_001081 [Penicillium verhagenii]
MRPFAIGDKYIQIAFPIDANDEEIEAANASGTFMELDSFGSTCSLTSLPRRTTEMSVFFACLTLRQITSRIHIEFGDKATRQEVRNDAIARGVIYCQLDKLLQDLEKWRSSTPVFPSPQNLYQMPEWYDLLCLRERLLLLRKAIDIVPKPDNVPPRDLLSLCLESAFGAITCFCRLYELKKITFTRSYFQMLFTAGLSVMFCLSVVRDFDKVTVRNAIDAMVLGENALKRMSEELSDAKRYVAVYEALQRYVIRKYSSQLELGPLRNSQRILEVNTSLFPPTAAGNMPYPITASGEKQDQPFLHSSVLSNGPHLHSNLQGHSSYQAPSFSPEGMTSLLGDTNMSEGSMLSWDIFEDNALWNMEAGLNEYAYGDPPVNLYLGDSFDFQGIFE